LTEDSKKEYLKIVTGVIAIQSFSPKKYLHFKKPVNNKLIDLNKRFYHQIISKHVKIFTN